jgi:hypothetical protein
MNSCVRSRHDQAGDGAVGSQGGLCLRWATSRVFGLPGPLRSRARGARARHRRKRGRESSTVVPQEVRRTERSIEREARRFQVGVRQRVALDPVYFRPNVEFAYGEVTALFGLNLQAIYRLPINSRRGR